MRVLYHLSHHQSGRTDGWSGAPGEAAWVQELVARISKMAAARGIEVVTVDGDLQDHPAFHQDYDAFIAPHYEADVHAPGARGWFWGRAASSLTSQSDDRLGLMFQKRYEDAFPDEPPEAFEWSNPNVTDYYAFRLTTGRTPGLLVEHGIGWGGDKVWLRDNIDAIARVHVDALAEFGRISQEEPVTDEEFIEKTRRIITPTLDAMKDVLAELAAGNRVEDAKIADVVSRVDKLRIVST